jgi:hypothetical protein
MADNPQTEVEVINDTGNALPVSVAELTDGNQVTKLKGDTDGELIGNINDALKVAIVENQVAGESFPTYSANVTGLVLVASPTDVFTLAGRAGKKVLVVAVHISGTKTNTGYTDVILLKRSTANSGGTSTTPTVVTHDSTDAASTAVVMAYTANPTLGTLVGNLFSEKIFLPSGTAAAASSSPTVEILADLSKPITLNGTGEIFAINFNGSSVAGSNMNFTITWIEV